MFIKLTLIFFSIIDRKEMFYLMMHSTHFIYGFYGVRHTVKDHSGQWEQKPAATTTWATLSDSSKGYFLSQCFKLSRSVGWLEVNVIKCQMSHQLKKIHLCYHCFHHTYKLSVLCRPVHNACMTSKVQLIFHNFVF